MRTSLKSVVIAAGLFAIAFALRWPSCGESFWLDELHTAWCTFGTIDQVLHRASIGNQQPIYFWALWIWQRAAPAALIDLYGIEAWLRSSSVLASAASASVVYATVQSITKSRLGGIAAGLAMALESSSIFYGTELRPYAWVILFSAIAIGLAILPCRRSTRWGMHAIVLLAAVTHLTSLIGLAPLIAMVMVTDWWAVDWWREKSKPQRWSNWYTCHLIPLVIWFLFAGLTVLNHTDLWGVRNRWSVFASPNSLQQVWQLWPWWSLILFPSLASLLIWFSRAKLENSPNSTHINLPRLLLISCAVILFSTFGCYGLSTWGGVPLWSRRYLVSTLPMLCLMFGSLVGWITRAGRGGRTDQFIAAIVMCIGLGGMTWQSGVLSKIFNCNPRLAVRGEDWKGAIDWIASESNNEVITSVWVDPALIEQDELSVMVEDTTRENYFRFVADGPYRIPSTIQVIGTGRNATEAWLEQCQFGNTSRRTVLLTRRKIDRDLSDSSLIEVRSFGRVKVLSERVSGLMPTSESGQ